MPGDMAMEGPDPRVIGVDLPDDVAVRREHLHVAPLWIGGVGDGLAVPVTGPFVQDEHVVAVEMHGMGDGGGVVDDDADRRVGAEVLDVPFGGIGEVALIGEEEHGVVVVCTERLCVELPEEVVGRVDGEAHVEVFDGHWWLRFECVVGH